MRKNFISDPTDVGEKVDAKEPSAKSTSGQSMNEIEIENIRRQIEIFSKFKADLKARIAKFDEDENRCI